MNSFTREAFIAAVVACVLVGVFQPARDAQTQKNAAPAPANVEDDREAVLREHLEMAKRSAAPL